MAERFGPYTLLHRIATGGMGEIHLARLERGSSFQKLVVIKRIIPTFAGEREFVRLFENEARIAAQLTHQNIVPIYDFGRVDETTFIAMEYVHGEDARSILTRSLDRGGPLPLAHAIKIGAACLRGLAYAHRRTDSSGKPLGIVHRDVSPQNILVSFEGEVKLTDFGLAKAAAGQAESQTGGIKGKYSYMSPEQVKGKPVGPASDIFSLATTLFELATGKKLFPLDDGLHTVLERISRAAIPDIAAENPELPAGFVDILKRALAPNPGDRFATANDMEVALTTLAREEGIEAPTHNLADFVRSLFHERAQVSREVFEKTVVAGKALADHTMSMARPAEPPPSDSRTASAVEPQAQRTVSHSNRRFAPRRRSIALAITTTALTALGIAAIFWPSTPVPPPQSLPHPLPQPLPNPPPDASPGHVHDAGPTHEPRLATLNISTTPTGARLWLNDEQVPGATPARVSTFREGQTVRVRLSKAGYRDFFAHLTLKAGDNTAAYRLQPRELRVTFSGSGIRATLAGRTLAGRTLAGRTLAGRTLAHGKPMLLPLREHHIDIAGSGATTLRLRIIPAEAGRGFRLSAASRPWTELRLNDVPTDNPLVDRPLRYGKYTMSFGNARFTLVLTLY